MRPIAIIAVVMFAVLVGTITVTAPALADRTVAPTSVQVHTTKAELLTSAPMMTAQQIAAGERALQELVELRRQRALALPVGAGAPPAVPSPQTRVGTSVPAFMSPGATAAPGDFTVFRSTLLTDAFTNNSTSSTDEPSLGMNCETILYTGNWYATVSADGGQTFTFVDPATAFPSFSGGFCCDQVVYYDESRDLMFWYLQYSRDGNGNNTIVLAWSTSNSATQNGAWTYISLSPQADFGYGNGVWFDFPEMSVSNNYVYFTTDVIGASENALALKMHLDDATDGGGVTLNGFFSDYSFLRPTHGAAGTMYIGTHKSTSEMRIYTWAEGDAAPGSSDDRGVNAWFDGTYNAPSPDGTDYLNFGIPGLLAAWTADGKVGFMWDSVQGGGYAWPNVRYATFNVGGLGLASQGQIWNAAFAFAYPSVHPNDAGNIAGTMALGGGSAPPGNPFPYPSFMAWIADDYNGDVIAPAESYIIAQGDSGPASNRWGDYLTSRQALPYGNTWAATGFVLNGGQTPSDVDPYFLWFGREADTPQPSITCPGDVTVECKGSCGTPANDSQLTAFFAGASASDPCGATISDDAPTCFGLGTTTVTFTAQNDLGLSASCTADVRVVDTTPPMIVCPTDTIVECSDHCGVPANDPQLVPFFAAASTSDICDPSPSLDDNSPVCFPLGETVVTFTSMDASGNTASCQAKVTVVDTTPPEIEVSLTPNVLWPPNHKMACISATVVVTDVCDPDPEWVLESITSSELDNGKGDGNTTGDVAEADTGTADVEFKLRSERSGKDEGRKYTIIYRATDMSGNVAWDTACVYVPHDQGAHAMASFGYNATGTGFELGAREVSVALLSHAAQYDAKGNRETLVLPALDAAAIDVRHAYIGNTAGVTTPIESRRVDVDKDGLIDMLLTYRLHSVLAIKEATDAITPEMIAAGAIWDGPVGLHVWGRDGTPFLVTDVFGLGAPVFPEDRNDTDTKDERPAIDASSMAGMSQQFDNGIVSIHPNPFNPATTIRFALADPGNVTIAVYDVNGTLVRTLVSGQLSAGEHTADWDGTDTHGNGVATGVYFARMVMGGFAETRKMVLVK